jgi:hypothetical protein
MSSVRTKEIKDLPRGDLTEADMVKLKRLREIFVRNIERFGFRSVPPSSLQISEDSYRPIHQDGFNLEFDISASDMIRTIWAYLTSLLELANEFETNHLGLLILDEPKQQETARVSFRELFQSLEVTSNRNQQVIVATSEDRQTIGPLLKGIQHQYISFDHRLLQPILT